MYAARIMGIDSGGEGEGGGSFLQLMESLQPWQILLIVIAAAVAVGVIIGIVAGKHQLKKASGRYRPLLTLKQRLVYLALFAVGAGFLLFGVLYDFSAPAAQPDSGIVGEGASDPALITDSIDSGGIDAPAAVVDAPLFVG